MKFVLLLLSLAATTHAGDWPQFRGPTGLGYTDEKNLPLKWDGATGENVRWKVELPKSDNPFSSPIVVGDRIIVTIVQNKPAAHRVLCYAKADGKLLWDTPIPPGPLVLSDFRGGYGAPTPCADTKGVYVVFGSAVVAALDWEGKITWRKELANFAFDVALGASPILFQDTIILNCDQTNKTSSYVAFNKADGAIRWEAKRPEIGFSHSTPVIVPVGGKPQMLVSAREALQALDPTNGQVLWWCPSFGDASSPAFDGQFVYNDSGRSGPGILVDPTGAGNVKATHVKWIFKQIPEGLSSPIIAQGLVWRSHGPEIVKAIRMSDGTLAFSERLKGVSTSASPISTPDGRVYFASAGKTFVVKASAAGDQLEILAENDLGDDNRSGPVAITAATPAISDGRIYLRGGKYLFCIGQP